MIKPWWLWEGAAVRCDGCNRLAEITSIQATGIEVDGYAWYPLNTDADDLTPIENLAVMLAPEGATHVHIYRNGDCSYSIKKEKGTYPIAGVSFTWSKCPDHLKGHTWPLPKGDQ